MDGWICRHDAARMHASAILVLHSSPHATQRIARRHRYRRLSLLHSETLSHNEPPDAIRVAFLDSRQRLASASAPTPACTYFRPYWHVSGCMLAPQRLHANTSVVAAWSLICSYTAETGHSCHAFIRRMCICLSTYAAIQHQVDTQGQNLLRT